MISTTKLLILFTTFIIALTIIYSIIITSTTFTIPEEIESNIPMMQPLPMLIVILFIIVALLIIGGRDITKIPRKTIK